MTLSFVEQRRPPRNRQAIDGFGGSLVAGVRMFADLQVASVSVDIRRWLGTRRGAILEVGCGEQPYRRHVPPQCEYVGIDRSDIAGEFNVRDRRNVAYYDGDVFPVSDQRFDSIFHTDVIEHVYEARTFLSECHRSLRTGGEMFFTVPFQARYHYAPHDFFRYTPAALQRLLTEVGFENIEVRARGTDITVAAYKTAAVGFRWAYGDPLRKMLFVLTAPLTILALVIGHATSALSLGSCDDCIGYTVIARRA